MIILFLIYILTIFLINNIYLLLTILLVQLLVSFALKQIKLVLNIMPFIIFTVIANLIFTNMIESIIVGVRLLIVSDITFIISYFFTPIKLSKELGKLFKPLKLFKINTDDITIIITIAISFIPILTNEINNIKNVMTIKCFPLNLKNMCKKPQLFFETYLNSIFLRVDELEKALIIKGYE